MINYDGVTIENIKEHNPNWQQISDHPYRTLIIGGSKSGIINALLNLTESKMPIIVALLIKFIYILKIQVKPNVNIFLTNIKILT